ncbi:MAG: efflux RND transporter periplasmic adaptor subunit [Bacteroidetes bacterium]|nr:efflux RND transporter periplasmic adaptor subunit [Bacteroidota bacterium]
MKLKNINRLFIFALTILLAACGTKNAQQQQGPPPAVPVTIETAAVADAVFNDEYPGTVNALDQISLTPQVTGYITGIYFKDGQKVTKGQRLYSIDAQIYKANYGQAVADLQVQEANLVKAQQDANRYNELLKNDAIAKQQVDYANANLIVMQKQVAAAKANVASLHSNVQFTTIYSPLTGTIGISQVKKGTSVVAGQTVLNTVSTNNPIAVDFNVDQKNIFRFGELQQDKNNLTDSIFTIAFGDEVYPYAGNISLIDRAVDPQTGTIRVRLVFKNDKDLLKPGMNTTVRVKNNSPKNSIMIPNKALTELLGEYFVYVLGDSSKVNQRKVLPGQAIGGNIIIKYGLKAGEKIVVEGVQNLHEGSLVKISSDSTK